MTHNISRKPIPPAFDPVKSSVTFGNYLTIADFWNDIPALVTSKVQLVQSGCLETRRPVIEYLRDLEAVARSECECRGTVQVIASGRRLLGDKSELAPGTGPFSRT